MKENIYIKHKSIKMDLLGKRQNTINIYDKF